LIVGAEFPPRQKPSSFSIDAAMDNARQAEAQFAGATGGGPQQRRTAS